MLEWVDGFVYCAKSLAFNVLDSDINLHRICLLTLVLVNPVKCPFTSSCSAFICTFVTLCVQ